MRLSFFTFSFFLLGTIYAAPLTIDPDYMKELQMNPNFEHHRPSNADYTHEVIVEVEGQVASSAPSAPVRLFARGAEEIAMDVAPEILSEAGSRFTESAKEMGTGFYTSVRDTTIVDWLHNRLSQISHKLHKVGVASAATTKNHS